MTSNFRVDRGSKMTPQNSDVFFKKMWDMIGRGRVTSLEQLSVAEFSGE